MTHLFYGRSPTTLAKGAKFRNALHFTAVEKGATKVTVLPGYPKIEAAYKKASVEVTVLPEATLADVLAPDGVEPLKAADKPPSPAARQKPE